MNGIEVEAAMNSHQMSRHTVDVGLKQTLALVRRVEQQQQKAVNWLIPGDESVIANTIGYEQVAVDLTSWLARHEPDPYLKKVYEFALLEDYDHLYRYANLMDLMGEGRKAQDITGDLRSEEHTSELQSLMRISYAVFCLKKKKKTNNTQLKQSKRNRGHTHSTRPADMTTKIT